MKTIQPTDIPANLQEVLSGCSVRPITIDGVTYKVREASLVALMAEGLLPTPISTAVSRIFLTPKSDAKMKESDLEENFRITYQIVKMLLVDPEPTVSGMVKIRSTHIAQLAQKIILQVYDSAEVEPLKNSQPDQASTD